MSNFSKDFYWGAATSSHQVEGNNHNDWTEFETKSAKRKAQNETLRQGLRLSSAERPQGKRWPDYILKNYPNPLQEKNYISGRACDHYNRFREDFDIAKSLGHNAHRFSIEWSRIEPEEGKFDEKEIGHYREVIKALRERGMEPFVTLWHWTLPLWVSKKGGWENKETVWNFVRYCEKMATEFKDDVVFFVTMSEPSLWCSNAYLKANFPPGKKNWFSAYRVFWNLHRAHAKTFRALKKINPEFQISITQNIGYFDSILFRPLYYFIILFFLSAITPETDFIGLDYYRRIPFLRKSRPDSDIGWETDPEGFYFVLKKIWQRFKKPIFVLENGIADARDEKRAEFIRLHIEAMKRAMDEGVDVRGYFHWSLLDNFEWENGFWPRFGLVEVDYKTFARKIRPSAWEYKKVIDKLR